MSIYTANNPTNEQFADIIIRLSDLENGPFGYAKIHITECWLNKVCGLCGKYDHNKNNDFMLPIKPLSLSEEYISTEGVELACEMNDDSWQRTNQFGDSWLDDTITTTSDSVSFDLYLLFPPFCFVCTKNTKIITTKKCSPEIFVAGDCLTSNTTQTLCIKAYEQDCESCMDGDDNVFMPIFDACLYDACAACNIDKMTKECVQPLTVYCGQKCNPPSQANQPTHLPTSNPITLKPTQKPSTNPTLQPTLKPTHKPTKYPTTKPTNHPTKKPSPAPTKRPTEGPTFSPTRLPTWSPTFSPTKLPTWSPSPKPTKRPTERPSLVIYIFMFCLIE